MTTFKYQIISTQKWNNGNEQHISNHKTLAAAERELKLYNKTARRMGNTYRIETL